MLVCELFRSKNGRNDSDPELNPPCCLATPPPPFQRLRSELPIPLARVSNINLLSLSSVGPLTLATLSYTSVHYLHVFGLTPKGNSFYDPCSSAVASNKLQIMLVLTSHPLFLHANHKPRHLLVHIQSTALAAEWRPPLLSFPHTASLDRPC